MSFQVITQKSERLWVIATHALFVQIAGCKKFKIQSKISADLLVLREFARILFFSNLSISSWHVFFFGEKCFLSLLWNTERIQSNQRAWMFSYLEGFSKALCLVLTPLTYDELLITMHKRWSFGLEFLQLMWTQPQESVLVFLTESRLMILVLKISKISFQKIGKFFFICSPFRYVWRKHRLTSIFKIYDCVLLMNVFNGCLRNK